MYTLGAGRIAPRCVHLHSSVATRGVPEVACSCKGALGSDEVTPLDVTFQVNPQQSTAVGIVQPTRAVEEGLDVVVFFGAARKRLCKGRASASDILRAGAAQLVFDVSDHPIVGERRHSQVDTALKIVLLARARIEFSGPAEVRGYALSVLEHQPPVRACLGDVGLARERIPLMGPRVFSCFVIRGRSLGALRPQLECARVIGACERSHGRKRFLALAHRSPLLLEVLGEFLHSPLQRRRRRLQPTDVVSSPLRIPSSLIRSRPRFVQKTPALCLLLPTTLLDDHVRICIR